MTLLDSLIAQAGRGIIAPGVYDALTALIAARQGFDCLYLSGASLAYSRLGRPDIGLVSVSELAETVALICDRVGLPLIVDGDTGFGNALNVQRTVRQLERAGAAAIQIEDQSFPKRCGHLQGKRLVSVTEMTGKIRAATDARQNAGVKIIARTDAIAVEGFGNALDRAQAYHEAGADILFIEAPRTRDELETIGRRFGHGTPLVANMVEGGKTPLHAADDLIAMGYRIVIFPGGAARAMARQAQDYYSSLSRTGSNAAFHDRMFDLDTLNATIGLQEMLDLGRDYDLNPDQVAAETRKPPSA